jgi:hypothetical protein
MIASNGQAAEVAEVAAVAEVAEVTTEEAGGAPPSSEM